MKIVYLFALFFTLSCQSQLADVNHIHLSVAPGIDREDSLNKQIITTLQAFFETKNQSSTSNKYWLASDFKKFVYPYAALHNIEQSRYGSNFYQPSLMEIIATKDLAKKIVKLAYVGHNPETKENTIRTIYNFIANTSENGVTFSSYVDYATSAWKKIMYGNIHYYISPQKAFNEAEARQQGEVVKKLCTFFGCKPIDITYYSCKDPVELFRIQGFDYNPMMYVSDTGGLAEPGNIVFSGNNSEYYTHEIVHVYIANLYPDAPTFLNEGIATYFGGSGKHDYQWHKDRFDNYLKSASQDLTVLVDNPFERIYIDDETPVAYIMGSIICEKIIKQYGKEKLFSLLQNKSQAGIWEVLKQVSITKDNFKAELQKQLR
jgi:hypothetical protein